MAKINFLMWTLQSGKYNRVSLTTVYRKSIDFVKIAILVLTETIEFEISMNCTTPTFLKDLTR